MITFNRSAITLVTILCFTAIGSIQQGILIAQDKVAQDKVAGPADQETPQTEDIRDLKLRDWQPRSMLKTKVTRVNLPKFPVIDVHNHLGGGS
ncbi:MAG: hypothetical protein KDA96_14245, partial [Planctomycetaceae bacterium]|nr:hypothetical protein [Planctomycetaceae bacterium]